MLASTEKTSSAILAKGAMGAVAFEAPNCLGSSKDKFNLLVSSNCLETEVQTLKSFLPWNNVEEP